MKRGSALKQKPRRRLSPDEREQATRFKQAYRGHMCHGCDFRPAEVSHHAVYEQHLKGPDKFELQNALPLCHLCHADHHASAPKLPRECLTEQNIQFASDVLGDAGGMYLARYYQ